MSEMDIAWEALVLKERLYMPHTQELVDVPEKDENRMMPFGVPEHRLTRWMKRLPKRFTDPRTKMLMDAYKDYDAQTEAKRARHDDAFSQTLGHRRLERPKAPKIQFGPRGEPISSLMPIRDAHRVTELPVGVPRTKDPMTEPNRPENVDIQMEPLPRPLVGASNSWWNRIAGPGGSSKETDDLVRAIQDKSSRGETLYENENKILSRWLRGMPTLAFHQAALGLGYAPKGTLQSGEDLVTAAAQKLIDEHEAKDAPGTETNVDETGMHVPDFGPDGLVPKKYKLGSDTGHFGANLHLKGTTKEPGVGKTFRQHLYANHEDESKFPAPPDESGSMTIDEFEKHLYPGDDVKAKKARTHFRGSVKPTLLRQTPESLGKYLSNLPGWGKLPSKFGFREDTMAPAEPTTVPEPDDFEPAVLDLSEDEPIDVAWAILKSR